MEDTLTVQDIWETYNVHYSIVSEHYEKLEKALDLLREKHGIIPFNYRRCLRNLEECYNNFTYGVHHPGEYNHNVLNKVVSNYVTEEGLSAVLDELREVNEAWDIVWTEVPPGRLNKIFYNFMKKLGKGRYANTRKRRKESINQLELLKTLEGIVTPDSNE
jgi:hypothetical protein